MKKKEDIKRIPSFDSLDEVLRAFLIKKDKESKEMRDNDWWWASQLGLCQRKHYFRRMGLPESEEKEFRIRFIAEDGKSSHEWREEATKEMGAQIASEERLVDKKLKYKGKFDLLIRLKGKPVIVDIKTQRPEAFFRRSKKSPGRRVEEFQKMQLASYVLFARKKYPKLNINEGRIYYVDRGGGLREEYIFTYEDHKMFDKVLNELKALNTYWKNKKFPPRTERRWECKRCPWLSICKKVDEDNLTPDQVLKLYGKRNQKARNRS